MFTGAKIALSQLAAALPSAGLRVERDCELSFIGKIPSLLPSRLVAAQSEKHLAELADYHGVAGVLASPEVASAIDANLGLAVSDDPFSVLLACHEYLASLASWQWEDFDTEIDPSADIHPTAFIEPKNVRIGAETVIAAQAVVCERSFIGRNCYVGPHSVIGAEAFELVPDSKPSRLVKQVGGVQLEDNVTVMSGSKIVRAVYGGFTVLEEGAAIDNLVHVAHDCRIGKNAKVIACAEVSGRVTIGENGYVGPNATISNGVTIGRDATVTLGGVVVRDVDEAQRVTGNFALPHQKWINFIRNIR